MTWEQHSRRAALIDVALHEVGRAGPDAVNGAALSADITREFGDLGGFLTAVAQRWFTAFAARLDDALERATAHGADDAGAVAEAWHEAAAAQPAAFALLRAHAGQQALRGALDRQARFLASVTGLDPAVLPRLAPRSTQDVRRARV